MGSQPHFDFESSIPVLTDQHQGANVPADPFEDPMVAMPADRHGYLPPHPPQPPRPRWLRRPGRWFWTLAGLVLALLAMLAYEARTSLLQARWLTPYAQQLTYSMQPGPSTAIRYPLQGPFDQRLGYIRLPSVLDKLQANGLQIEQQVQFSQALLEYANAGFYPPYAEKLQPGLTILDSNQEPLFQYRYPRRGYADFESVPPLMVKALLLIENRHLLDTDKPAINPAVDWGRFLKAIVFKVGDVINIDTPAMGGSTLATQIEKYRHSDSGVTASIEEKLRQMISASVRVYQQGAETLSARRELVLEYLNTVPLAAAPGYGEVNGVGDGLHVWFGANVDAVNQLLTQPDGSGEVLQQQGLAVRQVVALMIAHRRPSYYLVQNRTDLARLTDAYLRLIARKGSISPALLEAALAQTTAFRNFRAAPAMEPVQNSKGVNLVRNRLVSLLGVSLYDLDRLDLTVKTTLDKTLQDQVTAHLRSLRDPAVAQQLGLQGDYLLKPDQSDELRYSFTLFERSEVGNLVRVQTDNTDIPFDINEGSKLELGSTAKLRVLSAYLGIIAELHQRYTGQTSAGLRELHQHHTDTLMRWVLEQLIAEPELPLPALLNAALDRRYSASPGERFFTGGGIHTFNNYKREDNGRVPTVREALQESINLPFVRMLRDVINNISYEKWNDVDQVLQDDSDPRRAEMLTRFVDREGTVFVSRFWLKYQNKTALEQLDTFLLGLTPTPVRLAVIYRYLFPDASQADFEQFMRERLQLQTPGSATLQLLYQRYGRDAYNLQDQGYLARVHPLELWFLGYLQQQPRYPTLNATLEASSEQRQQVYSWLLRTKAKNARDSRVRTMLEVEAFSELQRRWKQLGYPFDHLVPSLATALGSSGDRPAALAELMGIILNDGERMPSLRITQLALAEATPYETRVGQGQLHTSQVMNADVANALKNALADVVNKGTARRLQGAFKHADGTALNMGGKTGTGDNRLVVQSGGQKVKSRALSRTATLVFYLGDYHFGTLTAFVPGADAQNFQFTSALPAQVLKGMAPILQPYLQRAQQIQDEFPTEYWHDGDDEADTAASASAADAEPQVLAP